MANEKTEPRWMETLRRAHSMLAGAKYGSMEIEARGYLADAIQEAEKALAFFYCQECNNPAHEDHDAWCVHGDRRCPHCGGDVGLVNGGEGHWYVRRDCISCGRNTREVA